MAIEDYQSLTRTQAPLRRRRCARVAFFTATASFSLLVPAVTQAAGNVSVRYRAPAVCPDQRTFEGELDRRLGDAPRPTTVLDVDVSVNESAPEASRVRGSLLRDGRRLRQLEGNTCDEIVKALALVAALAILPAEPGSAAPPDPVDPAQSVGPTAGAGPAGRGVTQLPPPRGAILVGLGVLVDGFTAPKPTVGGTLGVEARLPGPAMAPTFVFDFSVVFPRSVEVGPVRSEFRRLGGRVGTCPVGFVAGPFIARPCAGLSVDQIRGESSGIATPRTAEAVFASGHLFGRLVYPTKRFAIGLGAGAVVPFAPPRFIVENPVVDVHRVPSIAFLGQLDVAVRVF